MIANYDRFPNIYIHIKPDSVIFSQTSELDDSYYVSVLVRGRRMMYDFLLLIARRCGGRRRGR